MATKIVTPANRVHVIKQIIESISESSNTQYYGFIGNQFPYSNTQIANVDPSLFAFNNQVYRDMVCAKRITETDMAPLIRNVPYQAGKIFDMYDDQDLFLLDKDYYCVVNASSYYHVFKCLDNNLGANSTVEPDFSNISGANTTVYQTSDGYRWKYMYSASSADKTRFASALHFPVIANTTVSNTAVYGAVDVIKIDTVGEGYDNYLSSSFSSDDCRINGNTQLYTIPSNSSISQANGFYTGCIIYISSGTGVGQYKTVRDYFSNSNGNFIVIESEFAIPPLNGSAYEIYPEVKVTGDGYQTVNVVARALVNALASNSIFRVELIQRGAGYHTMIANVIANSVVGVVSEASIRPIHSPQKGHGLDAAVELNAHYLGVTYSMTTSESNTIPTENQFSQIGLIRDPVFANVEFGITSTVGSFVSGDHIYKINPVLVDQNCTINTTSAVITCNTADFQNQITVNDLVFLKSSANDAQQIAFVNSVTNSSSITISSNGFFACSSMMFYIANSSANGIINVVTNSTSLLISTVSGMFQANSVIVGLNSGARAAVSSVSRNGTLKSMNTFVQLYKYIGTVGSGSFIENEQVYQNSLGFANGYVHSVVSIDGGVTMYVARQIGEFEPGLPIVGANSGAVFNVATVYSPEVIPGTGEVLYVENINTVERANNSSELIKLVFEF